MKKKLSINQIAHLLRKKPTEAEMVLWEYLKNKRLLGLRFKRQVVIEKYIVDFYCYEIDLIIEIDGGVHKRANKIYQDIFRQLKIMTISNISFFRVTNNEILNNIDYVIENLTSFSSKLNNFKHFF